MTTEQAKTQQVAAQEPQQPPPLPPNIVPYPYNGAPYPHAAGPYPPFYSYPPPPADGGATENGGPPPPPGFMMFSHPPPPGMVFAYPPPQTPGLVPPQPAPSSAAAAVPPATKPKRKQVKMACTNCAAACKRCDDHRPCERCTKYGIMDTCVDGQRKERKKGIKRGPYKRKNKDGSSEGEWPNGTAPPPANPPPQPVTTIHAAPPQFPGSEGFYPLYYPPGAAPYLVPPTHDGEGHPNGQPPLIPYYIPGGYPSPFGYPFLHGAPPPPPQHAQPQQSAPSDHSPPQTVDPAATSSNTEPPPPGESPMPASKVLTNGNHNTEATNGEVAGTKKRKKSGEGKSKKSKKSKAAKESNAPAAITVEPMVLPVTANDETASDGD